MFSNEENRTEVETEKFVLEMAQVASDFEFGCAFMDNEFSTEMAERGIKHFLEKKPEESGQSPSDFFLNALFYATGKALVDGALPAHVCATWFIQIDHFLQGYGKYNTGLAIKGMASWRGALVRMGAI